MNSLQSIMIEEEVDQEIIIYDNPLIEIERSLYPEIEGKELAHLGIDQELLLKGREDNQRYRENIHLKNQNKSLQRKVLDQNLKILMKKSIKIKSLQAHLRILHLPHLHHLLQTHS